MIVRESININESFVDHYKSGQLLYEIHKNPSLSEMSDEQRFVGDKNGDLWCAINTKNKNSIDHLTHSHLMLAINLNLKIDVQDPYYFKTASSSSIALQRFPKTNIIALGESYREGEIEKINKETWQVLQKKHSEFRFIFKKVWDIDDALLKKLGYINEQYDSPEYKKFDFSKDDMRQMAFAEPYEKGKSANLFKHGLYHGKGSGELNNLVSQATLYNKDYNAIGVMENLYRILVKFIPAFKQFEIITFVDSPITHLHLQKEIILKDEVSGEENRVSIDLWIVYHIKGDKIFNYKKDKIKILFSPSISNTKKSYNAKALDMIDFDKKIPSFSAENYEITDKDIDKLMDNLKKSLHGGADNLDLQILKSIRIDHTNLTFNSFVKLIPKLKTNLDKFTTYLHHRYDV